jgi:diguanylate cyclase (GGDEF)-like protein
MIQLGIIVIMLSVNGLFSELRQSAMSTLEDRTQNKYQNLQVQLKNNWAYLSVSAERVQGTVARTLLRLGEITADIATDAELNEQLILAVAPELLSRMRANHVSGIFLIFNGAGSAEDTDAYAGVYLQDTDPEEDDIDNRDLRVVCGSADIAQLLGITQDTARQDYFTFPGGSGNAENDFFYQPLLAAQSAQGEMPEGEGYWSTAFRLGAEEGAECIAYSEPLINRGGDIYGVLGVVIDVAQVSAILSDGEYASAGKGCYFLGVSQDGGDTYTKITTGGALYRQFFDETETSLTLKRATQEGRVTVQSTLNNETMLGSLQKLQLYAPSSPFASQEWTLIGLADETTLFSFERTIRNVLFAAAALSVLLGLGVAAVTSQRIVRPIVRLVSRLKNTDPNETLALEPTNIHEIDQLADAMMTLNHDAIESATRLSKILKLTGLPLGVFEIRDDSELAYCTDDVFTLLGHEEIRNANSLTPKFVCMRIVSHAMNNRVEGSVYRLGSDHSERFVRIRLMREEHGVVGTVMDVTSEIDSRRKLEQERDYDLLTGILNRRAFEKAMEALFAKGGDTLGVAAMIMLDLDNLKFLNDTYGHDCGDGYIRALASTLQLFGKENALIARRSGDEFYVFLYGGKDKPQIRERINTGWKGISQFYYRLADGTRYKMRVSAGVAWYPADSAEYTQLIRYADFAMYKVKHNEKGSLVEFSARDYDENSFLISGRNALDRLIDGERVRYMVQPILSARTGETVGYELLMRTDEPELPNPMAVLRLACEEGKLQHIERLTWFKGLEAAKALLESDAVAPDTTFFINSIANQVLSKGDERIILRRYAGMLPHVVVEVTESERNDKHCTEQKIRFIKSHGGRVAIDDYGTGYNSELSLVKIGADIVKLDISLVRHVDQNEDKQTLIRNLIIFARSRGIAVLAEGVETEAEMSTLIRFGVDYLQGFYLGRPGFMPEATREELRSEIRRLAGTADE